MPNPVGWAHGPPGTGRRVCPVTSGSSKGARLGLQSSLLSPLPASKCHVTDDQAGKEACADSGSAIMPCRENTLLHMLRSIKRGSGKTQKTIRNFATDKTECKEVNKYLQEREWYTLRPSNQFHFIRTLLVLIRKKVQRGNGKGGRATYHTSPCLKTL